MSQVDKLPELPEIDNPDLLFSVHMHKDLKGVAANESEEHDWGDTDRLAEMGRHALSMALTTHYFQKKPVNRADEIKMWRDLHSDPERLDKWLESYKLKKKLRVPQQSDGESIYNNPAEMANYFYAYLGAIYVTKGPNVVQNWISKLVDPDVIIPGQPWERSSTNQSNDTQNRGASSSSTSIPVIDNDENGLPKIFVSDLNETAMKKGITFSWIPTKEGVAHLPIWTVRCLVNNVEIGVGQARDQKSAKLLAARRAWVSMGW